MCRWVSEGKPANGTKLTWSSDSVPSLGHLPGNSITVGVVELQWLKLQCWRAGNGVDMIVAK